MLKAVQEIVRLGNEEIEQAKQVSILIDMQGWIVVDRLALDQVTGTIAARYAASDTYITLPIGRLIAVKAEPQPFFGVL